MKWMEIMSKANPKDYIAILQYALVLSRSGKVEESIIYFKEAIEINPKDEITYSSLIISLIKVNKFS
jgi:tetratricopeptide (TPR) repeat protein